MKPKFSNKKNRFLKNCPKEHFTLTKGQNDPSFKNNCKLRFIGKIKDIKVIMIIHNEIKQVLQSNCIHNLFCENFKIKSVTNNFEKTIKWNI